MLMLLINRRLNIMVNHIIAVKNDMFIQGTLNRKKNK